MKWVSEVIGESYKNWKSGDKIFITAHTGTGKSSFILNEYLRGAVSNTWLHHKILYLVNRVVLKEQLQKIVDTKIKYQIQEEIGVNVPDINNYITIRTYQSIEEDIKQNNWYALNLLSTYSTVVYDECHYFYNDSNYNTYTDLSYDFLRQQFNDKIQIFMSATMEKTKEIILADRLPISVNGGTYIHQVPHQLRKIHEYSVEKEYDYVELMIFNSLEQVKENIFRSVLENKEKWLIFTDSIEAGKNYVKELLKETFEEDNEEKHFLNEEDVIFIDADYKRDAEAKKAVGEIVEFNSSNYKVIVSTAVMDNGISIHDKELRNVVLLADTEEAFVQMLGRKRTEQDKVRVYICRRDKQHFERRFKYMDNIVRFYEKYEDVFSKAVLLEKGEKKYYIKPLYYQQFGIPFVDQQKMLEDIRENVMSYEAFRKLCYPFRGYIYANSFAVRKCKELRLFYYKMIEAIEKDDDAFVQQQAGWLNLDAEVVEEYISASDKRRLEKIQEKLENLVGEVLNQPMQEADNLQFRERFRVVAMELYEYLGAKSKNCEKEIRIEYEGFDKSSISKRGTNKRPLTVNKFNKCMNYAKLNYEMIKEKDVFRIVQKL